MRELERESSSVATPCRLTLVGQGRLGHALGHALEAVPEFEVEGPLGHGADGTGADVVLLCVPDRAIAAAAEAVVSGPLVGHCSGATTLAPLGGHEGFSLHPLMTVTSEGASFAGAGAAVAAATPRALAVARRIAEELGMVPVEIADGNRVVYHTAASMASNFLLTLEAAAERLAREAGLERELLVPLVRATVENWARLGSHRALTGPVARGEEATVERQRGAIQERAPELLPLFDVLVAATRTLAAVPEPA